MNHQAQIDSVIAPALEALRLVDGALPGYFIMAPGRHVPPPPGFPAAAATAHVAGAGAINPAAAVHVQIPAMAAPPGFPPAPAAAAFTDAAAAAAVHVQIPVAPPPRRCRRQRIPPCTPYSFVLYVIRRGS